jgi:hypothetical protein
VPFALTDERDEVVRVGDAWLKAVEQIEDDELIAGRAGVEIEDGVARVDEALVVEDIAAGAAAHLIRARTTG